MGLSKHRRGDCKQSTGKMRQEGMIVGPSYPRVLLVYFSLGETVRKIAVDIRGNLDPDWELTEATIEPTRPHTYRGWLWRSCLPGWKVPIKPTVTDVTPYDLVCLGFPKWGLSCPPVAMYVSALKGCAGKSFVLFMSHRGFDQDRYLHSTIRKLSKLGVKIAATVSLRQEDVKKGLHLPAVRSFCRSLSPGWREEET